MATGPVEERGAEFDFLVCDLCRDALADPCVLPCWHVFCLQCLVGYTDRRANSVVCPPCQRTFSLPADGLVGLQGASHDFLIRVVAGSSVIRTQEENGYLRHYCRDRELNTPFPDHQLTAPVNRRCEECEELLCHRCTGHHLRERHAGNSARFATCKFHGKSREMFCESCEAEICRACADGVHRRHEVIDIASSAPSRRRDLAAQRDRLVKTDAETTAEEYLETIRQMIREQTDRQLHDVTMQVARKRRLLESQVDKMAAEARRDIEAEKKAYMSAHGGFSTSRRDTLSLFQHLVDCGTEHEIVELYPEVVRYLAEAMPERTQTDGPVGSHRNVVFTPVKEPELSSHDFIGSLEGTGVTGHHSVTSSLGGETSAMTTSTRKASSKERDRDGTRHKWKDAITKLKAKKGLKSHENDAEEHEKPSERSNGKDTMWASFVDKVKHSPLSTLRKHEPASTESPVRKRRAQRRFSVDETAREAAYSANGTGKRRLSLFTVLREEDESSSPVNVPISSEICEEAGNRTSMKTLHSEEKDHDDACHEIDTTRPDETTKSGRDGSKKHKLRNKWSQLSFDTLQEKDLPNKTRRRSVSDRWLGLMSEDKRSEVETLKHDREVTRARLRRMWAEQAVENGANPAIPEAEDGDLEADSSDGESASLPRVPNIGAEDENGEDKAHTSQQNGGGSTDASLPVQDEGPTLADRLRSALNISFLGKNTPEEHLNDGQDEKTAEDILTPREAESDRHDNGRSMNADVHRKSSIGSILSTSSNLSLVTTSSLTSSDPEDGSRGRAHKGMKQFKAMLKRNLKGKSEGQQQTETSRRKSGIVLTKEITDFNFKTDGTDGRGGRNSSLKKKMKQLLKK